MGANIRIPPFRIMGWENRISKLIVSSLIILLVISFMPDFVFASLPEVENTGIYITSSEVTTTVKNGDEKISTANLNTTLTIDNAQIKSYEIQREQKNERINDKKSIRYEEITVNIVLSADSYDGDRLIIKFTGDNKANGFPKLASIGGTGLTGTTANWNTQVSQNTIGDSGIERIIQSGSVQATVFAYYTAKTVAGYKGAPIHLNITVAAEDTSQDPRQEDVIALKIKNPPNKTEYRSGEFFEKRGLKVVAILKDGSEQPIVGYTFKTDKLTINDNKIDIRYGDKTVALEIKVLPSTEIISSSLITGQYILERSPVVYSEEKKDSFLLYENTTENHIVVPYGETKAKLQIETLDGIDVFVDKEKQTPTGMNTYILSLPASEEKAGKKSEVTLKGGTEETNYVFACHQQKYDGLPTKVTDYLCIGSQYTNGAGLGPYGIAGVATLVGGEITSVSGFTYYPPASLGNYGGYIVYYYKDAIYNNPKNPYGIDFIVYGNSHNGTADFAEPGQVWVAENENGPWYALAGSLHYDANALWNSRVTYTKSDGGGNAIVTDDFGNTGKSYYYPAKEYYPLFNWENENNNSIELNGIRLVEGNEQNAYGNTLPPYPAFGYADCGIMATSNLADNPYSENETYYKSGKTDGFDLAWAVDENGNPVIFENGIHYIKVQTATLIDNGAIGEKSTELHMVRTAKAKETNVGKSANAKKIVVDGKEISLQNDRYQYNVDVAGIFEVKVDAYENANVYINGARTTLANFEKAAHGMVRIIIQEGEKEPVIYHLSINDKGQSNENTITTIKFDGDGGRVLGEEKFKRYYDKESVDFELPIPVRSGYEFLGWYGGQQKYTKYEESMPEEVNLVAKWKENNPKPLDPEKKITVSFRLIGATQSKGDVDLSSEEKSDYKGAEYVTWIPTRSYTLPEGSTVYDLFAKAMKDTGMKEKGGAGGYVSSIWAPSQFGGYALSEFTNGKYSGWMYTMNGNHTDGIKVQKLLNNAEIVFHYVNDYRYEVADWAKMGGEKWPQLGTGKFHNEWLKAPDRIGGTGGGSPVIDEVKAVTTSGAAGSASTTAPTEVKVSGNTATATIKAENQSEILKQAAEKKSAEIILEVSKADSKGADSVQLSLEVSFVKNISDKTDADLTVNTENGKVTLDQETIKTVLAEAKGATITLEVTKVSKPTEVQKKAAGANGHLLKLTIKSGDKVISDFNKGKVKVVAEIVSKLLDKKVAAIHIADDGKIEQMAGKVLTIGGKKYYEFTTPHFSTFALVDADELGLDVAEEPQTDVKALTAKLTPVARSAKTAKKNVKVTVSLDKQDKAIIKELKDAGYTVKYRFYRSTKKAAGYKAAVTKKTASYTNTSGKKGTKYYYKVQIRVYDADGKLAAKTALKQCKYASRTWTKGK